ncbi:MAG: FtsX-like permease family protein [Candidatus Thorarchaeota archaeon]|nr:FtsX-like permease family protein [Candidatus Thorarchaeota archaeon]
MYQMGHLSKSTKRRGFVTFICFLIIITVVSSTSIFIDSDSLSRWNYYNDIGPVAMKVEGDGLENFVDEISNISYVTQSCSVQTAQAYLRMDQNDVYYGSPTDPLEPMFLVTGRAYSINDDFLNAFPTEFALLQGRFPLNESEITIAYSDAAYWNIPIGRMMNYTHQLNSEKRTVFVVGYFEVTNDALRAVITDAVAIVTSDVLNPNTIQTKVYIDVDRSIVFPSDPVVGLTTLRDIENRISSLSSDDLQYQGFFVDNYLANNIQLYLDELNAIRSRQLSRLNYIVIIGGLLAFLGVRFNAILLDQTLSDLEMRGASKLKIRFTILREIVTISVLAGVIGLFMGIMLSKVAYLSSSSKPFDIAVFMSGPLLISSNTIVFVLMISIILPLAGYAIDQLLRRPRASVQETGRIARIVKSFHLIQWDFAIIIIVTILMILLYIGGPLISDNQILSLIASYSQIPLFISVASLSSKIAQAATRVISRLSRPLVGRLSAAVGMRRVSKKKYIATPVVLIITIVFSLVFVNNSLVLSLPNTHLAHSRYLIGGDICFKLEEVESERWVNFTESALQTYGTQSVSLVSISTLSLSEGASGVVEFVAINPEEYSHVGYNYAGVTLDQSDQQQLLNELEINPEGAVLTSDIALEYNLNLGDTMRVFSFGEDSGTVEFSVIGITNAITRPIIAGSPQGSETIGTRKIWLNRNYIQTLVNLNETIETYLCIRTINGVNSTEIVEGILDTSGLTFSSSDWSSVTHELDAYTSRQDYIRDRAIDTMLTFGSVFSIFVGIVIYRIACTVRWKEEDAILSVLGASNKQTLQISIAEILALFLFGLGIFILIGPLTLANMLRMEYIEYSVWNYEFPVSIVFSMNWIYFIIIILSVFISSTILAIAHSLKGARKSVSTVLREMTLSSGGNV